MKNNVKVKQSEKMIEPIITELGEFFWYIKDVCRVLEIDEVDQAINELDPEVWAAMTDAPGQDVKGSAVVNDDGLFALLLRGQAPIAKEFRRWVTRDLLFRVLVGEEPLHDSDRAIKEKLLTSGLLPDYDRF